MSANTDLEKKVSEELEWDPSVNAAHIGVAANGGIITLTGHVDNYFEKKNAEHIVKRVTGVKAVVDKIELELPGSSQRSDIEIAESVVDSLKFNVLIPQDRVQATVENGRVTLEGEVEWQYQRSAAEDSLRYMLGVKEIVNRIVVKPAVRVADIKSKIQSALVRNAQIDANQIVVDTKGGTAILSGHVRSWAERDQAEVAAWAAPGVVKVENDIRVNV